MMLSGRVKGVVAALGVVLMIAGCTASTPGTNASVSESGSGEIPGMSVVSVPVGAAVPKWSPGDGVPTEAQYRQSVENQRQCMIDEGVDVGPLERDVGGTYSFGYQYGNDVDADELLAEVKADKRTERPADRVWEKCWRSEAKDVQRAYHGRRYVGAERDEKMAELIDCLEEQGYSGFDPAETSSGVFLNIIEEQNKMWKEEDPTHPQRGIACFSAYTGVWPAGDPNSPPQTVN